MIELKKSYLFLASYNLIYALIILIYIVISCLVLIYNYFYNEEIKDTKKYIYGNNKKLLILFVLNFIFGFALIIKGIIYMKAQCSEKDYYRTLNSCINFKKY